MDPQSLNIKVVHMDVKEPIDFEYAVQGLGGEKEIFYMMLGKLESMTLDQTMKDIVK
jgi:hypothetical protein